MELILLTPLEKSIESIRGDFVIYWLDMLMLIEYFIDLLIEYFIDLLIEYFIDFEVLGL